MASQLLSGYSVPGRHIHGVSSMLNTDRDRSLPSVEGFLASVFAALAVAIILSLVLGSGPVRLNRKRTAFLLVLLAALAFLGPVYTRRRWLHFRREQSLSEITSFVSHSHNYDNASSAALSLVQEVELVSRGYRLSV